MLPSSNTNSVQNFIRVIVWLTCMLLGVIPLVLVSGLSSTFFGTGGVLGFPFFILMLWVSGIISGMFFVLPEWEAIVLHYRSSIIWLSTEALKNTIGSLDLKDLLSERDQIAESLKVQLDADAAVYGIDIRAVRITDIDTPATLVEELAVIARARRSAEAKKVEAEAEVLVAEKISEATKVLSGTPGAMKLRELQLLSEMSKQQGNMVVVYPYGDDTAKHIGESVAGTSSRIKA